MTCTKLWAFGRPVFYRRRIFFQENLVNLEFESPTLLVVRHMTTRPSPAAIALDAVKKTLPAERRSRVPDITLPSGTLYLLLFVKFVFISCRLAVGIHL